MQHEQVYSYSQWDGSHYNYDEERYWEDDWYDDAEYDDFFAQTRCGGGGASTKKTWYQGQNRHVRKQDVVKAELEEQVLSQKVLEGGNGSVGLVSITGEGARLFVVKGGEVSQAPLVKPKGIGNVTASCSKKGGQSAPRFQRAAEQGRSAFVREVAEAMLDIFLTGDTVQAVAVCGSAELRKMLLEEKTLTESKMAAILVEPDTDCSNTDCEQRVNNVAAAALLSCRRRKQQAMAEELQSLVDPAQKAEALELIVYGQFKMCSARRGEIKTLLVKASDREVHQTLCDAVESTGGEVVEMWDETSKCLDDFDGCIGLLRYVKQS